jgi:hypothetical protein
MLNSIWKRLSDQEHNDSTLFARWGRGVSYHDFVLALGITPEDLPIVSCKELFLRTKTGQTRGYSHTPWRRYEKFIRSLNPGIHEGFFLAYLDIVLQKPA